MLKKELEKQIENILRDIGVESPRAELDTPAEMSHGEYSCNVALAYAKVFGIKPADLAQKIVDALLAKKHPHVESIEIAGAGFINFHLSSEFFVKTLEKIISEKDLYGKNDLRAGEKVIVEYTDPNPFKQFHIGHLMSNAVGETISRLIEFSGAKIKRANYQGDVGLHVAKAIWGMQELSGAMPYTKEDTLKKIEFLGGAYVHGSNAYTEDESAKKEIDALNKVIFEKSDDKINGLYDWGRKVSLEHFEDIYAKLGTKFDYYFFESETAPLGMFIAEELLAKGIFEKSEGAVVFKGEQYGLHTRVFVNSAGLPTYETKDLGLNKMKFDREDFDLSIIITANEQNEYFKVMLKALEFVDASIANKTRHISHGMLLSADGKKMSSRKGDVITGESLIVDVEKMVYEKIADRGLSDTEREVIMSQVAVGAIKYSILRQSPGRDIIFDFKKSLSFEGDSGPYLQYAHARACSVLRKAKEVEIVADLKKADSTGALEKMLIQFPNVVVRAEKDFAPQLVVTYLTELAGSFNAYYANTPIIIDAGDSAPYRVALTSAFAIVMKNGLWLLGMQAPERM